MEAEDTKMNQMMWWKHSYTIESQSHTPPQGREMADACFVSVNNFFFILFYFDKDEKYQCD
jgi:hypothetical protein